MGVLPLREMLPLLNGAPGKIGTSYDYLSDTLAELTRMEAKEPKLEELMRALEANRGNGGAA